MSSRERILAFLREPKSLGRSALDPEIWRDGLTTFAVGSLAAHGEHPLRVAQVNAWTGLAEARAGLILGPPGTGKTHLLSWLILGYIHARRDAGLPARVYVSAFTRNAIGNLLDAVASRAAVHDAGTFAVRYIGSAPPAGLSARIKYRSSLYGAEGAAALADLQPEAVVMGGSVWSLYRLLARPEAGGDGFTAELFDLVCIDEASQMVLAHGLMALAGLKANARVVVAGDDRQLPPIRSGREVLLGKRQLGGSLYAFLKSGEIPEFPLEETFRLNGPLAAFPERKFYPGHYRSAAPAKRLDMIPGWKMGLEPFAALALDPDWPIAILLHEGSPAATSNEFEASIAARLAEYLADRMDGAKTGSVYASDLWRERLAIISPHRAQNVAIRNALPELLRKGAFVETVDRIQGKERDAIILSYCVADAEFALAEADFIYAPERLNVAVTRARTKLIVIISRRLLDAVPTDQEQMDKAELLREFVFAAAPKGEILLREIGVGEVKVQLRLLGFGNAPELEDLATKAAPKVATADALTNELKDLLDAVKASALASPYGTATITDLRKRLASRKDLLPGLAELHAQGYLLLEERQGRFGVFWTARSLDPARKVFATDLESVRRHAEEAISQSRSGRLAPFYERVRRLFAWMSGSGEDMLKPQFDVLKDEGRLTYGTTRGQLTVEWNDLDTSPADAEAAEPPPQLSDEDFRVLNALEDAEAARINFGVFEAWTSAAGLADEGRLSRDAVTASFGRLAASGWVMLAADGRVRSRMAELAREVRYVKQRFKREDAHERPYLVRSLKLELRDRDKPKREEPVESFFAGLAGSVSEVHARTLLGVSDALRRLWGSNSRLAAFQARSIAALTRAWSGDDADAFVIAADTGSGKTEAAALALIAAAAADRLLGTTGLRAILAYPRIRLATNQAQRLARYLSAFAREPGMPTLTLGVQVGQVPETFEALVERDRDAGWTQIGSAAFTFPFFACPDCDGDLILYPGNGVLGADRLSCNQCDWNYDGWIGSKVALRKLPPAMFLPTTDSLHQWLHDKRYGRLFGDDPAFAPPRAVVADEIHLYTHVHGAQVGHTLRRLAARSEANGDSTRPMLAIGMSATLGDPVVAWGRLIGRDRVSLLTPMAGEKRSNPRGREYFYFIQPEVESRGQDIAGASSTIQTVMCLAHGMRRRTGREGGFRALAFLDSIDKIRRLHAAYDDAETRLRLAAYRTRLFPDDSVTGKPCDACCREPHGCDAFRDGECWYFAATDLAQRGPLGLRRPGTPLKVAEQPVFSGATGKVEALIKNSDVVFATSSLEVGYDDPDITLVYQHYAPQNLASFVQRKGRGGRGSDDRPITGATLSIYSSRDSWWFRQPHEMIEPSDFDIPLNPDNHFVRRGQVLAATLDAFARYQYRKCEIDLQNPPDDALSEAEALTSRIFGPDPWREFDQPNLRSLWSKALAVARSGERLRYPSDVRKAVDWIPDLLFDTINLPRLRVRTSEEAVRAEDVALTMATAAPGNATRRYDPVAVYWRPPANGRAPWLAPEDYANGSRMRPFGHDPRAWLALLPNDARQILDGLSPDYFRPAQLSFETLGRMFGTGWQSDWVVPDTNRVAVQRVQTSQQDDRRVRHDSRGSLRGYPVVKVSTHRARAIDPRKVGPWVHGIEYFLGDGLGGKETGLALARVFWGADAEVILEGPPSETVVFSQVFTDPTSDQPLLHGYHVQTEGVRFKLNADLLNMFVESELIRLSENEQARRWHAGQMLRFLVESKAQAAAVNAYDARRGAELLVSAAADPELKQRLTHLLNFWSAANLETLFEDTRARFLSQHPLLSPTRVKSVAQSLSDQRFQLLFSDVVRSISRPDLFGRYIKSAVIHSLAVRLKESFIQVGRADERQVIVHAQLPIQFSGADDPTITLCEAGAFGDGTTRSFIAHFDEAAEHWRDGFIAGCANAREDAAMRSLFEHASEHEAWRRLNPNDPTALASLTEPLGLRKGTSIPAAVLRVLYGAETVDVERFELYDVAVAIHTIDQQMSSRLGRKASAWELTSAVVEAAKTDNASTPGRLLSAYARIEAGAQDESLSPEARVADQVYRLNAPLCLDGCRACVHQGSDLMTESMAEASTSRTLLERFICAA